MNPHDDPDTWGEREWSSCPQNTEVEVTAPHVFGVLYLDDGTVHPVVAPRPRIGFEVPS